MSTSNPGGGDTTATLPKTTSEHFSTFEPGWAELHRQCPGATVFQHPRWILTWLRHYGAAANPVYLTVHVDDELVGAVALDLAGTQATLLGDPDISDYGPILAAPGYEETVARGVSEWLVEDLTPAATLWGIPGQSPLAAAFEKLAPDFGWEVTIEDEAVTPVVELPADWEAYLANLSKKDRHELRRKLRQLDGSDYEVAFDEATSAEDTRERVERLLELMRISRPDKAEFLTAETEAFFRDVTGETAGAGMARLSTLWLNGEAAAMTLAFENDEAVYLYNSGYDPAYEGLSLGIVSKALALRSALDRGKTEYNLLRGDEDYKRHLGGKPQPVVRINLRRR